MKDNGFRHNNKCPYCNHILSGAFLPSDEMAVPIEGDLSICIKCAGLCKWNKKMKLVKFNVNNLFDEEEIEEIKKIQEQIKNMHALIRTIETP